MSGDLLIKRSAVISDCGHYRLRLDRVWDDRLPPMVICGLNPSTADGEKDDPTIRREMGFARRENCGALVKVNLAAFRTKALATEKGLV